MVYLKLFEEFYLGSDKVIGVKFKLTEPITHDNITYNTTDEWVIDNAIDDSHECTNLTTGEKTTFHTDVILGGSIMSKQDLSKFNESDTGNCHDSIVHNNSLFDRANNGDKFSIVNMQQKYIDIINELLKRVRTYYKINMDLKFKHMPSTTAGKAYSYFNFYYDHMDCVICELEDEYFLVRIGTIRYKCDGIEGLEACLKYESII